jgi:hypothetical protein
MLSNALRNSAGEYNMEQLKTYLTLGIQNLIVSLDGDTVHGAATIAFENYPNDRIAFVTSIGGKFVTSKGWQIDCY